MPFVNVKLAGPALAPAQVRRLQQGATRLMANVLRKDHGLTAVFVDQAPIGSWTVGGNDVQTAAHLKVTEVSNMTEEKSQFVAAVMEMFRSVLGNDLCPVAYVVIHEVPGDAWGWDGLTQAHRARPLRLLGAIKAASS